MTAERHRRIARILDLRAKELEKRITELATAQNAERAVLRAYNEACARTSSALATRDRQAKKGSSIEDWSDLERWVAGLKKHEQIERTHLDEAARALADARGRVKAARMEQEKIQRLLTRLVEQDRVQRDRADQRTNDDAAAAQFLRRRNAEP